MKKLLLATFLVAVLVGVSYIKSIMGQSAVRDAKNEARTESAREMAQKEAALDSLKEKLSATEISYAESLKTAQIASAVIIDSLEEVNKSQHSKIADLSVDLTKAKRTAGSAERKPQTESADDKIIRYYKDRCARLPGDLTEYERKVSLNEIREETADKFSITTAELKSLREKYRLEY